LRRSCGASLRRLARFEGGPDSISPRSLKQEIAIFLQRHLDGKSGRDWLSDWVSRGRPTGDPGLTALTPLFEQCLAAKLYVRNLNPESMWFDGQHWLVTALGGTLCFGR